MFKYDKRDFDTGSTQVPGNAVDLSSDLMLPSSLAFFSSFTFFEGGRGALRVVVVTEV